MTKQELGPNQTKWLEDLETTKAPQGQYSLFSTRGYCCLGRACEIFLGPREIPKLKYSTVWVEDDISYVACLPPSVVAKLGLRNGIGSGFGSMSLATLNDGGKSFKEIAAIIREDPSKYFYKSA